ncbi:DNA translocase FtsK [Sesbania bispinosa]|nr:DNA translocase FtsK [Sesbania bispinosa]
MGITKSQRYLINTFKNSPRTLQDSQPYPSIWMANLSPTSREEEDLRDRSTKKVKFEEAKEISMEESVLPDQSLSTSPKGKASYKDMVMSCIIVESTTKESSVSKVLPTKVLSSPSQDSCFGPWMLAKKPQRRTPNPGINASNKDGGNFIPKSNGSRFDVLQLDSEDNGQPSGNSPSSKLEQSPADISNQYIQQQQQSIVRVRDPKGGKNTQQQRSNKGKQSPIVSKQVNDKAQEHFKAKNKDVLSDIQLNKSNSTEVKTTVSNGNLPVRAKPIPPRTQEQKKTDHEFALQLIKRWGSPQELQIYQSIQTDYATNQEPLNSSNPMAIDGTTDESIRVVDDNTTSQEGVGRMETMLDVITQKTKDRDNCCTDSEMEDIMHMQEIGRIRLHSYS